MTLPEAKALIAKYAIFSMDFEFQLAVKLIIEELEKNERTNFEGSKS